MWTFVGARGTEAFLVKFTQLAAFLILAMSLGAIAPHTASATNTDIGITSVSTTDAYGGWVDVYGYGLDNISFYASDSNGSCCWYPGYTTYDSGHFAFNSTNLPLGTWTLNVYSYNYGESDTFCCVTTHVTDNDGDGYASDVDCNDNDWRIHPGAYDTPYDGIDQNCDGQDTQLNWLYASAYANVEGVSDDATFGVRWDATNGFDNGIDAPQPPTPPADNYAEAYFNYPQNAADQQHLSTSFISGAATMRWDLHVDWHLAAPTNCYGCSSSVQFYLPLDQIPIEFNVFLVDGQNIIDLRAQDQNSNWFNQPLDSNGTDGSHDMSIVITTEHVHNIWMNQGWSLVSVPATLPDMSATSVLGPQVDRVLTWDGSQYVDVTELTPGVGYWVHSTDWHVAQVFGTSLTSLDITLHSGWNLVGAPAGWYTPLWTLPQQVSQNAFAWFGNGYYTTYGLYEGYGFWVYNAGGDVDVHLQSYSAKSLVHPAQLLNALTPAQPDAAQFVLPIHASDATGAFADATLRATAGASDGFDAADVVQAPAPATSAWTLAGFHAGAMMLASDTVAPLTRGVFALDVAHQGAAGTQTLSWSSSQLAKGYTFELVDGLTRVDMRSVSSYSWDQAAGSSTKSLVVSVRPTDAPTCAAQIDDACLAMLPFDPRAVVGSLLA